LLKSTPFDKVLESISEVVAGGAPMSPSVAHLLLEWFRKTQLFAPVDKSVLSQLTQRQIEVLQKIVQGKSYKQVAEELFISIDTVKFHVKKIYEILHVTSRHELTVLMNR
jgi:DNA-binding NarL/FixJ family response regulator